MESKESMKSGILLAFFVLTTVGDVPYKLEATGATTENEFSVKAFRKTNKIQSRPNNGEGTAITSH